MSIKIDYIYNLTEKKEVCKTNNFNDYFSF